MRLKFAILISSSMLIITGCQSSGSVAQPQTAPTPVPPAQTASLQAEDDLLLEVTEPQDAIVVKTNKIRVSGTTSPDADVSINDQFVVVDASGRFTVMVSLEQGPNALEVAARDENGNEAFRILTIIYIP
jgi:hypothetical protein